MVVSRILTHLLCLEPKETKIKWRTVDLALVIFFFWLGILTRFFRIQFPRHSTFDEVHFGGFIHKYLVNEYFFDIHPPTAKLIMAGMSKLMGYESTLNFTHGANFESMDYIMLRSIPAFFGSMVVPITYLILRVSGCSVYGSAVGAGIIASDIMLIVESRFVLTDGILHFMVALSVLSIVLHEKSQSLFSLTLQGVCIGLAVSTKLTSGGLIVLAFVHDYILQDSKLPTLERISRSYIRWIYSCLVSAFVFIISMNIHLSVLVYLPSDSSYNRTNIITQSLVNRSAPDYSVRLHSKPLILRSLYLAASMLSTNFNSPQKHPYSSSWYNWPLFTDHWVLFYSNGQRLIATMGNVFIWYPVFITVVLSTLKSLVEPLHPLSLSMLTGYLSHLLPFILIPRETFMYHYSCSLMFGIWLIPIFIENSASPQTKGFLLPFLLVLSIAGFLLWCPFAYGLEIPDFRSVIFSNRWI